VSNGERAELLRRAYRWWEVNQCPLPLDLATDLMAAGIDVEALEQSLEEAST
jgi:hypothetical protein